jgi:hypothetical protein
MSAALTVTGAPARAVLSGFSTFMVTSVALSKGEKISIVAADMSSFGFFIRKNFLFT